MRSTLLAVILALFSGCAPRASTRGGASPGPTPIHLVILGVNDFHGSLDGQRASVVTSGGGSTEVLLGGAELLAGYLARERASDPDGTILLSAGDMWQGTLASNHFEGKPGVLLDDYLHYDAAALGNHEFDYGPVGPVSLADPTEAAPVRYGALLARMKEMRFPLLAANVRTLEAGAPAFAPWVMLQRKGVRVGVVGLATEETPDTTIRPNVAGLEFDPPGPALIRAADQARKAGAELVIGVGHLGGECLPDSDPEDPSSCRRNEEVMRMLDALPPHTIDAFVAGHTHQFMAHRIDGVPVIESGAYGVALGRIDLELDPVAHSVLRSVIHRAIRITSREGVAPDTEVTRLLAPYRQEVAARNAEVIGRADHPIGIASHQPSALGALVTEQMLAASGHLSGVPRATIAIQNSGGLRLPLPAGKITYGDLYRALPFDNVLATMSPTGEELERLFQAMLGGDRLFQVSGITLEVCGSGPSQRITLRDASGVPLQPSRRYVVIWNDFLGLGGDGMKELVREVPQTFHRQHLLREVIAQAVRQHPGSLDATDGPLFDPSRPRLVRRAQCP